MHDELRRIGHVAQEHFRGFSLEVPKLHYYVERLPQMAHQGIMICFDAVTADPNFFGSENYPRRGSRLMLPLYKILEGSMGARVQAHV